MNNDTIMKQPVDNEKAIIVNQILIRSIDTSMKEISTFWRSYQAATRVIWPIRQLLYDHYTDIQLDGHLCGLIEKRLSAVLNKKIFFKDAKGKKVDVFDELIKRKNFRDLRKEIFNIILWGITGIEFIPGKEFEWIEIPRKHIKPEYKIIAFEQNGFDGIDYTKQNNLMIMGDPHDLGLLLKCCPYAIWKRGGFGDWAQFVEIFGQPVEIVRYDAYDVETKAQVEGILENRGAGLKMMLPKQAGYEMLDGKTTNANGDLQDKFKTALNDEMSVIVLGNTETTTSSKSSGYAQSKQHGKQQMEITKSDLAFEMLFLNSPQFMAILKSYGFPVTAGGEFTHEQEADVNELSQRILVDAQVAKIVPISDDYFYEIYNIPKPDNYDELKAKLEEMNKPPEPRVNEPTPPEKKNKKKQQKDNEENLSADESGWEKFKRMFSFFD